MPIDALSSKTPRTDLSTEVTTQRPTPKADTPFRDLVTRSASSLVQGAQSALTQLPGGPVLAAAVRGGMGGSGIPTGNNSANPSSKALPTLNASTSTPMTSGSTASPALATTSAALTASKASSGNPLTLPSPETSAAAVAEGPGAAGGSTMETALQTSSDMNLYYLQMQETMATENRVYTAQSNVLKARHDTVKNAIGNIR